MTANEKYAILKIRKDGIGMAYSVDLRMAAVRRYQESGDAFAETGKLFHVSESAVQRWVTQYEETGNVFDKPLNRGFKKIDPAKLRTYVKEHPDATQREIADEFGCCNQAVSKAFKRLNITRKKNASLQRARRGKSRGISGNIGGFFAGKARLCR